MSLDQNRTELYARLEADVTNTALVDYSGPVPNGNKIVIKMEMDQPFGSHYDRVFLDLFRHYEGLGAINPGDKVLETTSGSAGVSFAGIGEALGYHCIVAIPSGGEKAREDAILRHLPSDEDLIFTPEEDYVNGFTPFLKRYLVRNRGGVFFINHSMGEIDRDNGGYKNNDVTLKALAEIASEVLRDTAVDHFVSAVGNGSNTLGIGRVLKAAGAHVTAFETFQSGVTFERLHPGRYEAEFGIRPGSLPRHNLPGTSYNGIAFPHIRSLFEEQVIDDAVLVSGDAMDRAYEASHVDYDVDMIAHWRQKQNQRALIRWDKPMEGVSEYGRSTQASIAVALDIAANVRDKTILVIGYDKASRYDTFALAS